MEFHNKYLVNERLENFINECTKNNIKYALLNIVVEEGNQKLRDYYNKHIDNHNKSLLNDLPQYNSGFDLVFPEKVVFDKAFETKMVNHKVKAQMIYCDSLDNKETIVSSPFLLYARSSISKTPLMLANHVGVVDSGYRGFLIGAFRCLPSPALLQGESFIVEEYTRLIQVCHASLCPIYVQILPEGISLNETLRGEGGFGSTGII